MTEKETLRAQFKHFALEVENDLARETLLQFYKVSKADDSGISVSYNGSSSYSVQVKTETDWGVYTVNKETGEVFVETTADITPTPDDLEPIKLPFSPVSTISSDKDKN